MDVSTRGSQPSAIRDVWRLRSDLQFVWVREPKDARGYWVVKDPLTNDLFCLSALERLLLDFADGSRSLTEVCRRSYKALQLRSRHVSFEALLAFYTQARRQGLLVCDQSGPMESHLRNLTKTGLRWDMMRRLLRVIAFRLPGVHPGRMVDAIVPSPNVRWLYWAVASITIAIVITALLIVGRFDQFQDQVYSAFSRRDAGWWFMVLLVVAAAKSIHELGHLLACRAVGAESREVGLMLLCGAPCLYCDVSDLWTIPERQRRVLVSSAGVLAELGLASAAAFVWASTHPSRLHDLALIVVVVCSVSTLVVNANPLLRYDGYFVLADYLRIPNLAMRAAEAVRSAARRWIWGPIAMPASFHPGREIHSGWLVAFGITSGIYRVGLLLTICVFAYRSALPWGLGWLISVFTLGLAIALIIHWANSVLTWKPSLSADRNESSRRSLRRFRAAAVVTAFLALLATCLLVPLPRRFDLPAMVVMAEERAVHTTVDGTLLELQASGTRLDPGSTLVVLQNPNLEDNLRRAEAEVSRWKAIIEAWQRRRGAEANAAEGLELAKKQFVVAKQTFQSEAQRFQRLTIHNRRKAVFVRHPSVFAAPPGDPSLMHQEAAGQFIPAGRCIGWLGSEDQRSLQAFASERQAQLISPGHSVRLNHESLGDAMTGTVKQIRSVAANTIPPELIARFGADRFASKHYLIRIELDAVEKNDVNDRRTVLLHRIPAIARVESNPASLWQRAWQAFWGEYRGL
jgi:putative peptide zinc metalloprotease protein